MIAEDPAFWRAGAISSTFVMLVVLGFLTVDSLATIRPGGANVPLYTVINKEIRYEFDVEANRYRPVIGAEQLLFGRTYSAQEADEAMHLGKLVIQSRRGRCRRCRTPSRLLRRACVRFCRRAASAIFAAGPRPPSGWARCRGRRPASGSRR